VVAPLVEQGSGARIAVVRGFVSSPGDVAPPPTGTVQVDGALAAGESPAPAPSPSGATGGETPAQQPLGSVDLAVLVNRWPGELYNGFVFAQTERAVPSQAPVALPAGTERVPPPTVTGGLKWRNAAYALQWWLFAGFAAFMWFRMVRDDARRD
jgi:cytochrome oxidase assembly protein ShyY1